MHHSFSDEFASLDSFLSRMPVRFKIISCLVLVISVVLMPISIKYFFVLYALFTAYLIFVSRIPLLFFLRRLLTVLPFVLLVAVSVPFIKNDGWVVFINCLVRAVLIILTLILLIQTTRFSRLLNALAEFKVPELIIKLLSFMYRYLFVVEDEALRKKRALDLRSAGRRDWAMAKSTANMLGSLFVHAYERAERIYLAMCARGYESSEGEA